MFIFRQKNGPLNEANEKSLMPSGIVINVQKIFALLHAKAVNAANKIGDGTKPTFEVQNTAAEGNDPKSAVFHSAGEHMILAKVKDGEVDEDGNKAKIDRNKAFEAIKEYVNVFLGPDVAKKLTVEDCIPMRANAEVSESKVFSVSFSQFLTESKFEMFREADEGEDADESQEGEDADENQEGEDADEIENDEDTDEIENDEDTDEIENDEDTDEIENDEDASEGGNGEDGEGGDKEDPNKAEGFYMLYGLKIAGLKETTPKDALKKWATDIANSFAISFGGWGGDSATISVKDVKDFKDEILGVIKEPGKFERNVKDKLEKKFPNVSVWGVNVRDKKTLLADLDKENRENYGGKARQKISQADYSLTIEVKEKDPDKPFVNRKELASIVTSSLPGGLIAKFKNLITADSIIYLRGAGLKGTNYDRDSGNVLSINELRKLLKDNMEKGSVDVIVALEEKFKQIKKNKQIKNTEGRDAIAKLWDEYTAKWDKELEADSSAKIDFTEFESAYAEIYKRFFKKDESMLDTGTCLMSMLFEDFDFRRAQAFVEAENNEEDIADDDEENEEDIADDGEENEGDGRKTVYTDTGSKESPNAEQPDGNDLYIIPMKNIKFKDDDDD